jgi:aryl-alcohol dehydrogenase (NADP+)
MSAPQDGSPAAQAALAWLADRPGVTAPIVGARTVAQLRETLGAAALHLDAAATTALDDVSAPDTPPYPYWLLEQIVSG